MFKIKGQDNVEDIEFSLVLSYGDLVLRANGVAILCIDAHSGLLDTLGICDSDLDKLKGLSTSQKDGDTSPSIDIFGDK